jgi:hypothetical protein
MRRARVIGVAMLGIILAFWLLSRLLVLVLQPKSRKYPIPRNRTVAPAFFPPPVIVRIGSAGDLIAASFPRTCGEERGFREPERLLKDPLAEVPGEEQGVGTILTECRGEPKHSRICGARLPSTTPLIPAF